MRRAAKVDANQPRIVDDLRQCGYSVQPLHTVGQGCPDLLVGAHGICVVLEVKDGEKPPSAQRLTPDEEKWHVAWKGQKAVVRCFDEAVAVIEEQVRRFRQ